MIAHRTLTLGYKSFSGIHVDLSLHSISQIIKYHPHLATLLRDLGFGHFWYIMGDQYLPFWRSGQDLNEFQDSRLYQIFCFSAYPYGSHGGSLFCSGIEFDAQDLSLFPQELSWAHRI